MTTQTQPHAGLSELTGPLMVLAGGICIGFAPIGVRLGLEGLGPQALAFWRYAFAFPVLFLLVVVANRRLPARPNPFILVAGACFALDIALWHWSLTYTTVANATFIVNLGNIGVGFLAWLFLKETPSWLWGMAVILAILGAAGLSLGGAAIPIEARPYVLRGDLLALGAAILVSGYMLASKVARRNLGGLDTIFWLTGVEILVSGMIVLLSGERFIPEHMIGFLVPLFLALVVQVGGQGLIITGLGHTPAGLAGVLVLVQPVVAAAVSWRLFGEALAPLQAGGAVLILVGIFLAQRGNRQNASKASQEPITSFID
ncbi:MAG: DMT family transporter [Alphaproteobacteria bacterium]|nr:DMT family transporter [Alphaproteobacteria bacterium]